MNVPLAKRPSLLMERVSTRLAPKSLETLDQWGVIRHLGSGSSAEVWLLEDKIHRRQVACKTPRDCGLAGELSKEAKLAAQLSHENIIRPINVGDDPELSSLKEVTFWEFLAGGTLTDLVGASGQLSIAQTVTVVLPMIQAAQYLLARHIVHGDISPRNILFDLTGRPVLIDFGATRATAHQHARTGTPGFVAPELVLPTSRQVGLDASADIYALAAVAWFCLTGRAPGAPEHRVPLTTLRPELDPEIFEVLEASLSASPLMRPDLDQLLDSVAQWAIPEPVDLYASVGEQYELVLPTRQPEFDAKRKRTFKLKKATIISPGGRSRSRTTPKKDRSRVPQRITIALGSFLLACGVVFTMTHEADSVHYSSTARDQIADVSGQEDFQAVLDELAKARSAVWAATAPDQVEQYALIDSEIFHDDVELLSVLAEAGHYLEGIRMRAGLDRVSRSGDITVLSVTWRIDGYVQRDAAGEAIQQIEPHQEAIELELVETANGWRMVAVG